MIEIPARNIGEWLYRTDLPGQVKFDFCWKALAAAKDGEKLPLEVVGKCACHLIYRLLLDNYDLPLDNVLGAARWAQEHCWADENAADYMKTRWFGSISVGLIYLDILRVTPLMPTLGYGSAIALCERMLSDYSVECHPQNALNIMRCCMLRAAYHLRIEGDKAKAIRAVEDCQRIYKLAVASLAFDLKSITLGDEAKAWSLMLKLSIGMGHLCGIPHISTTLPLETLIVLERQEPFHSAFIAMCGGLASILPPVEYKAPTTREELARLFVGEGAELGVAGGGYSSAILKESKCTRLYSIDRWSDHHNAKECLAASKRLVTQGKGRCIPLRMSFDEALPLFEDGSLDFLAIDGYAQGGQDNGKVIEAWYPKLRSGGILAIHDYHMDKWPLNTRVINEFAAAHSLTGNTTLESPTPEKPNLFPTWHTTKP